MSKSPDGPSAKFQVLNSAPALLVPVFALSLYSSSTYLAQHPSCTEVDLTAVAMPAVHTLAELKLSGNHLKGSRPVLSFHQVWLLVCHAQCMKCPRYSLVLSTLLTSMSIQAFDGKPHLKLLKEMLTQVFATPKGHQKSKPFLDHVISFSVADGRIWLRNYQVSLHAPSPKRMVHGLG